MAPSKQWRRANELLAESKALYSEGKTRDAIRVVKQAIDVFPESHALWLSLGILYQHILNVPQALRSFEQALKLKPGNSAVLNAMGASLFWSGKIDKGLDLFEKAAQGVPEDNKVTVNIGVGLLLKGEYERGVKYYTHRDNKPDFGKITERARHWSGESLEGKAILVTTEQGMGDSIQFIRYVDVLKTRWNCRVVLISHKNIYPLLATYPHLDALHHYGETFRFEGGVDYYCQLLNVPEILMDFDNALATREPYLGADTARVEEWQRRLSKDKNFRIGICWQGSFTHKSDHLRSMALAEFRPLMRLQGVSLYSLQKGAATEQIAQNRPLLEVTDLGSTLDENCGAFLETAAVLKNLDLVITCDTSVGHLAGSLGVRTWLALAITPDWRWGLDKDSTPWYPNTRLFRQQQYNRWDDVFDRMTDELLALDDRISIKPGGRHRVNNNTIRARHGLISHLPGAVTISRCLREYGEFAETETRLMSQLLHPGETVVDISANIGALTLPMARLVGPHGQIHAIEPRANALRLLQINVSQNQLHQVSCHALSGVGEQNIDSLKLDELKLLRVAGDGKELQVLQGANDTIRRLKPILVVRNEEREHSAALIEWIQAQDYRLYWHVSKLFRADNYFRNPNNGMGNLAVLNMLCIHKDHGPTIGGLEEIRRPTDSWSKSSTSNADQRSNASASKETTP